MKNKISLLVIFALLAIIPLTATAQYNPKWEWRTVKSDNFTVYYPEGSELFAGRILSLSNEVHDDISGYLGVKPKRCSIVINPGTDSFNGVFSPFPNKITLYETPSANLRGLGNASDLLDVVFTHEYTHFAHLTTRRGWYGALTKILGDGLALSNAYSPMWITEGIATNVETLFTNGGRGRDALFHGTMMSFTDDKGMWSLSASGTSPPYEPPANRFYLSGYYMIDYLNRTYGEDAFTRIGQFQAWHPLGGTRKALLHVTEKPADLFYSEFLDDLELKLQLLKNKRDALNLPAGNVLIESPLDSFDHHFWRSDGTLQVLRSGYESKLALLDIDPQTGDIISETFIGIMNNVNSIKRSPDGSLVMGERYLHPLGNGQLDSADLVIFDPYSIKHARITEDAHIFSADLSPDGKTFVAAKRNGMWIDIVLIDRDGSNIRPIVSEPGMCFEAPCWSPDGSMIATVAKCGEFVDIVLIDPLTGEMIPLFAPDTHEESRPSFSPDGRWILFSSDRSGIWNIHAWDQRDKNLYQLTSVLYATGEVKVSPDGRTMSFTSLNRGLNSICTLPFNPLNGIEILVGKTHPITSPDISRLQPDIELNTVDISLMETYRPFIHSPYFSSDEQGSSAGFYIIGGDPLDIHSYSAKILYGLESQRFGYDVSLTNRSYWPTLNARVYDSSEEGNTVRGGRSLWMREQYGELSTGLNVIHSSAPAYILSSYNLGVRMRKFIPLEGHSLLHSGNQSTNIYGELGLIRTPDHAPRDMIPSWGQSLGISLEKGLSSFGGKLAGHNMFVSLRQYMPSLVRHHGFALTVTEQMQKGLLLYNKDNSLPRGYHKNDSEGHMNARKNLLFTLEYHFPLLFTDKGLGLMLYHMNLLKGSVFVDCGAGWNDDFVPESFVNNARTSLGVTVTTRSTVFSVAPIEFGVSGGLKTVENEWFATMLFTTDL